MGYGGIIGQQFDGYTQNQTLTQAVAALYGLGTDAVPNDVFNILSQSALYKNTPTIGLYTPTDQLIMSIPSMGFSPARIVTGSYVGTGTYGSGNPNTITVGTTPKLLAVSGDMSNATGTTVAVYGATRVLGSSSQDGFSDFTITWSSNGVSWYSSREGSQMNISGAVYCYTIVC